MPKLERWLIVAKNVEILTAEDIRVVDSMNAQMGGGWNKVHQHLNVNAENREAVETYFTTRGFEVVEASDKSFFHPENSQQEFAQSRKNTDDNLEFAKEKWAIGKSFEKLGGQRSQSMLSDVLIEVVRDSGEKITRLWLDEIARNPTTQNYRNIDQQQLARTVNSVIQLFARWLGDSDGAVEKEVRDFYRQVGRQRRADGLKVYEVFSAVTLLRKYIFFYARSQGVWERPIDVYRVLELDVRLVLFFDIAMYHILKGYGEG